MKMFFLKTLLILSLMFIAVLYGMQLANEGIHRMKGYEDERFQEVWTVTKTEEGEQELTMLGTEMGSHDLEAKKEKLEELKAYNFFAELGKGLSNMLKAVSEKMLEKVNDIL